MFGVGWQKDKDTTKRPAVFKDVFYLFLAPPGEPGGGSGLSFSKGNRPMSDPILGFRVLIGFNGF